MSRCLDHFSDMNDYSRTAGLWCCRSPEESARISPPTTQNRLCHMTSFELPPGPPPPPRIDDDAPPECPLCQQKCQRTVDNNDETPFDADCPDCPFTENDYEMVSAPWLKMLFQEAEEEKREQLIVVGARLRRTALWFLVCIGLYGLALGLQVPR